MSDGIGRSGTDGNGTRRIGGRYRVLATLGQGGMATVYRALDEQLGREVAVKVFRIGPVDHGERNRAEGEISVLANLRHPSLVTLYDAAIDDGDGESYLVMELVPGTDLATRLRDGRLDQRIVALIGAQVADGLAAVHAQGIVHRDVKPANVLIEDTPSSVPRVKLADFGIALLRDSARVTGTGLVMGTAAYLAPEQVTGQEIDGEADVYALGLMLLEALTGRQAYTGSAIESATARLTRAPEIDRSLPVGWRTLLHTMTATAPDDRPTAEEAADRLRALGRGPAADDPAPTRLLPGGAATGAAAAGAAAAGGLAGAAAADDATTVLGTRRSAGDDVRTTVLGAGAGAGSGGAAAAGAAGAGPSPVADTTRGRVSSDTSSRLSGPRSGSESERARRARTRAWIIAAVVLALAVVVALVVLAARDRAATPTPTDSPSSEVNDQSTPVPSQAVPSAQPSEQVPSTEPSEPAQPSAAPSEEPSEEPSQEQPSSGPEPSVEPTLPVQTPTSGALGGADAPVTTDAVVSGTTAGDAVKPGRGNAGPGSAPGNAANAPGHGKG